MQSKILFNSEGVPAFDNMSEFINQLEAFHRFIISATATVVGKKTKTISRRLCKVFSANVEEEIKANLSISLQKKSRQDLIVSYYMTVEGVEMVNSVQAYTTKKEIQDDLEYIVTKLIAEVIPVDTEYSEEETVEEEEVTEEV